MADARPAAAQELGASFDKSDEIPADIADQVAEYREKLIDMAVELDDDVMERYLEVRSLQWLAHAAHL